MAKGSVITTHLLDGDPQGIRRVFIKNKTCEMYILPRTLLPEAKMNSSINLNQPGLYILLESLSSYYEEKPKAYIGHGEDVGDRIDKHINDKAKEFFELVLIFVSTDHSINKADVQYLEYHAINAAKEAGRFDLSPNTQKGTLPHLSPDQLDVVDEFREFVWMLTSFAGCKIFIPPISVTTAHKEVEKKLFYLNWDGLEARALYGNGEMVILKGSELRPKTVKSANPERRAKAIDGIYEEIDGRYILKEDMPVSSPSRAAWLMSGTGLNGWDWWKTKEGQSLDYIYRKKTD